jgi:hypothetical protein
MKNKKDNKKYNKCLVFTILILALCITIISIEIITITLTNNAVKEEYESLKPSTTILKYYPIDDSKFEELDVTTDYTYINSKCNKGCNLKVDNFDSTYYYMITYSNTNYTLNIIKNDQVILSDVNLGSTISSSYFTNYKDYILFYNEINDGTYIYDYAVVCDDETNVDEFTSLSSHELELTNEGIIYYYDVCADEALGGSQKIKAIRMPFNISPKVLNTEYTNLSWCEN